jgi:adenylate kinase family enzyme
MKIMIFGRPGSGKSTFAYELAQKLDLPLHHLDKYFYTSHWKERDEREFLEIVRNMVNRDRWIMDGNSIRSLELRYAHANLCIYFNYPRLTCLYRIFKRVLMPNRELDDKVPYCNNTVRWRLIKYMWNFESRVADQVAHLRAQYPQVMFIEVKNNAERDALLCDLESVK